MAGCCVAIKAEYEDGDPRNLLWAFSFLSYSMPSLVQSAIDSFVASGQVLLSMREECIIKEGSELYMGIGVLLEVSKSSARRRRFAAAK